MCLPVFPHGFASRLTAAPLCLRIANTGADPHTTRNIFHRMWVCFFMKREDSTRDARQSVRHKNSNHMSKKKSARPSSHRLRTNVTNKGDAKRRHKSSTGMRGSFAKDVGPLQHTSHARVAFDPARNEQNHFAWCVNPHRLKTNSRALVQLPAHWNGARPRRGES